MPLFPPHHTSDTFWERLLDDSSGLAKEAYYPKYLQLDRSWEAIFRTHFDEYHQRADIREAAKTRLFVDGKKTPELLNRVAQQPPKSTETLEEWGTNLFEGKPWCIVLDKISFCSEALAAEVAQWMEPYFATLEPGRFSTEISPYVGHYGYTPFGAHLDIEGITILHLHLGPGSKQMTIWPEKEFQELTGSTALHCYDFAPYIDQGTTYTLEAGDVFHLPASKYYHIGKTDTFSVGITIGLKHESHKSMLKRAIKEFQKDPHQRDSKTILEQFKWKRKSNNGFIGNPLLRTWDAGLAQHSFQLRRPFPIVLGTLSDGNTAAFARGRQLPQLLSQEEIALVQMLNTGTSVNPKALKNDKQVHLLQQLYTYCAIETC